MQMCRCADGNQWIIICISAFLIWGLSIIGIFVYFYLFHHLHICISAHLHIFHVPLLPKF